MARTTEQLMGHVHTRTSGRQMGQRDAPDLRKGLGIYSMLGTHLGGSRVDTPVQEVLYLNTMPGLLGLWGMPAINITSC